ncbi:hypothetical protein DLJ49_14940 [Rhodovulum sp. 12E13]|uniref:hypothetical protein n=1 Tax=Rhodovulum sp. 12E13 TaxID=2203891 RepID=UPI000E1466E8|nr:hypothetical protein [Rhodovulum sp. 12E13]RDC71314.1 hypothetical protein DLJ49_14940 [Rhodovulum sp. 12E13]
MAMTIPVAFPEAEATGAERAAEAAAAELDRLEAEAGRIARKRRAALAGTAGDIALGDGSYARQRRDELAIRRADLASRAELAQSRAKMATWPKRSP